LRPPASVTTLKPPNNVIRTAAFASTRAPATIKSKSRPRNQRIDFGAPPPEDGAEVPLLLRGASSLCYDDRCFEYGDHRALATIELDGVEATALIDTGTEFITISESLAERLPRDNPRMKMRALELLDRVGMIRVRRTQLGEASVKDAAVLIVPRSALFTRLSLETGTHIEALLGTSYLRRFATTFDLEARKLELRELEGYSFEERTIGLGLGLQPRDGCYFVHQMIENGAAEQAGVRLGDCLTRILGFAPGEASVEAELEGLPEGASVEVVVRREDREETITLAITRLLD
jgi:hypothetical protein